jgi:peptidoglycan/LPS O-acetylase OafA/YrhL
VIEPVFPFLNSDTRTDYLGDLYREPTFGGLFWCYPWLIVLFLREGWKKLKREKLYGAAVGLVIAAVVICIVDVQMMGITMRYGVDFSFLFGLAGVLLVLANWRWWRLKRKRFFPLVLISLIMGMLLIFAHDSGKLFYFSGDHSGYHEISRLVQWWL